ncbi:YceD family protein [Parvularcula lutaonensis]|uniref:YceD family protein n=1 Tax=Parvularcula lutaonensis TaxID=491923 RepID=A0ABV7MBQ9_9PROT|nr:DUF177 domain-containing protein [Parvularcula lutaonensis]GGY49051.1 phosphodiesterase [Parvularcula lutaonensis]
MTTDELESIHHPIALSDLDSDAKHVSITASEADRRLLAERYDVTDVIALKGDMDVTRHGSLVRVAGSIEAELGRTCVVSLEPMRETIAENFAVDFTTEFSETEEEEVEADLDAPEPLKGDHIDLGDVLLEQLVLAMDPHPRKEGAEAPKDPGAGKESSPFDVLKGLKE